jgi:benzaldehyde dehydrogenase (NAD)
MWENTAHNSASDTGQLLNVFAPATGELLATVKAATTADVDSAADTARNAQTRWAAATYEQRASVLRRAARLLEDNPSRLAQWMVPESGSTLGKARFETMLSAGELNECAALASHPYGELLRSAKPRLSIARKVPLGVVGVIAPFNFPALLALRSVAPALAVGNAVILKPDPRTPISGGLALAHLMSEAGLPEGVLQVLPGGAEVGQAIVEHPHVPCVSFTGSTAAGRAIASSAAPLLKRLHLELGGNNAMLVLPDADIEAAVSAVAWGSFLHQGQVCMAAGRVLVHTSVAENFSRLLAEKAEALVVGDPSDPAVALGPVIDEGQRDRIHAIVEDTVRGGARVVAGGHYDGLFYRPTVLVDVTADSPAFSREIFGPVAPVMTYDSIDDAVAVVNGTEYGLTVSILTDNAFTGYELAGRIDAGMVHINDQPVDDEPTIPHGGTKASGLGGHFGGARANLEAFCETQWITVQSRIERYPF